MSSLPVFKLNPSEYAAGAQPVLDSFARQDEYYAALSASSRLAVEQGDQTADLVPAILALANAVLGTLAQPSVVERLPREITYRAHIAQQCSRTVVNACVKSGMLMETYQGHEDLRTMLSPLAAATLNDTHLNKGVLGDFVAVPFHDVSVLGGGAARVIGKRFGKSADEPECAAPIVARSFGLLAVADLGREDAKDMNFRLGLPYARAHHYVSQGSSRETAKVALSEDIRAAIRGMLSPDAGCPARTIKSTGTSQPTVLKESYDKVVRYLIPDNATAYGNEKSRKQITWS